MDDRELVGIINTEEDAAEDSELHNDREQALDYFYGRATGRLSPPAIPNRSSYVSRDVADTIDWIMPSLVKTFLSADQVCQFTPETEADVPAAKQETDYVNYIALEKNNAYEIFSAWFDDALVQKTGYVWAYWKTENDIQEETYEGLAPEELSLLMQDKEVEISEANENMLGIDPMSQQPMVTYDVVLQRKKNKGHVCYECVPPELVKIGSDVRTVSIKDARFVGVDCYMTISEIRELGYDVNDDISDEYNGDVYNRGSDSRQVYNYNTSRYEDNGDPASRIVRMRYRWMRVDYDGDGVAELRNVILIGDTILYNEKADIVPIAAITPRIIAHNHNGRSLSDVVEDIQELKTQLIRGLIDNVVLTNNGRYAVDENVVNLDDLTVSRPGGVVRINGTPTQAIVPLQHSMLGAPVLTAIEMLDGVREVRTGVTKYNMGTDSSSLNSTATGVSIISNAANQRIEWIARTFAETGVANLFRIIHALTRKHSDKEQIVRLRDDWVVVDPRTWVKRMDMTVTVGLGATNREVHTKNIMNLGTVQERAFRAGIVSPENVYNMAIELANAMGFKDANRFFTHPSKMPKQDPMSDPKVMKIVTDSQNAEKDRELKREELGLQKEQASFDNRLKTVETIGGFAGL